MQKGIPLPTLDKIPGNVIATASAAMDIQKTSDGEHFIINTKNVTFVAHNLKEAQIKLMKLFEQEYKGFFDETNKST